MQYDRLLTLDGNEKSLKNTFVVHKFNLCLDIEKNMFVLN